MRTRTMIIRGGIVAFIAAIVFALVHFRGCSEKTVTAPSNVVEDRLPVVLTQVREMVFEESIRVSGNVEAKNTALVSARVPGVLDEIYVAEGDSVEAGQSLFQTNKEKLNQAVEIAEQQVVVAAAAVRARRATVARIQADLEKAKSDYERYKRLYEQDHAVSKETFEIQELRYKQLQAGLTEATAGIELAQAQEQQAESNLAIVQKDLSDSLVGSPIRGRISQRLLEPGEMAGTGAPVLRVDDLSVVEIVAFLSEAYYARIVEGSTVVRVNVQGKDIAETVITTKSPVIHPKLRTFEIKALLNKPPVGVVPGARAELYVVLQKRTGLGVPRAAVVRRGGGLAIFSIRDAEALMLAVETGLEANGWVEVSGGNLVKDMPVVHMGQDRLNDKTAVVEVKEDTR